MKTSPEVAHWRKGLSSSGTRSGSAAEELSGTVKFDILGIPIIHITNVASKRRSLTKSKRR